MCPAALLSYNPRMDTAAKWLDAHLPAWRIFAESFLLPFAVMSATTSAGKWLVYLFG